MRFLETISNIIEIIIKKVVIVILVLVLILVLLPLILIFSPPIFITRKAVSHLSKILRPDLDKILSSISSSLSGDYFNTDQYCSIVVMCRLKGSLELEEIKSRLVDKVIGIKKVGEELKNIEMKQYPYKWMGFVFWKWDEHFDISNHVKYYQDGINTETKLNSEQIVEIQHSLTFKHFPEKRSPWQIIVIPNVESESGEEETIFIFWLHHILCDGFSILKLLCYDLLDAPLEHIPHAHFSKQNFCQKFLFYLKFIKAPYDLAENLVETFDRNDWVIPRNQMSKKFISVVSDKISMDVVKDAKNALNSSVNAVILSALTAAIRKAMLKKNGRVPKKIHLGLAFPVKGHPDKLRNSAVINLVRLPVGEEDPVIRLKKMEKILNNLKVSTLPATMHTGAVFFGCLFYWMISFLNNNFPVKLTIVGTTFPGPKAKIYFNSHEVADCHSSLGPIVLGCGLNFTSLTYNNYLKARFMVNEKILDQRADVEEMAKSMLHEFLVLKSCAQSDV